MHIMSSKAHSSVEDKDKEERQARATYGTLRAHFRDLAGKCDKNFDLRSMPGMENKAKAMLETLDVHSQPLFDIVVSTDRSAARSGIDK